MLFPLSLMFSDVTFYYATCVETEIERADEVKYELQS